METDSKFPEECFFCLLSVSWRKVFGKMKNLENLQKFAKLFCLFLERYQYFWELSIQVLKIWTKLYFKFYCQKIMYQVYWLVLCLWWQLFFKFNSVNFSMKFNFNWAFKFLCYNKNYLTVIPAEKNLKCNSLQKCSICSKTFSNLSNQKKKKKWKTGAFPK